MKHFFKENDPKFQPSSLQDSRSARARNKATPEILIAYLNNKYPIEDLVLTIGEIRQRAIENSKTKFEYQDEELDKNLSSSDREIRRKTEFILSQIDGTTLWDLLVLGKPMSETATTNKLPL